MTTTSEQMPTPANDVPGPKQGYWTYSHYAALPDDGNRYEIIDGVLYFMPPSPNERHQRANNRLATYLTIHVEFAGLGQVYTGPFSLI
ncbi:MAG: Uma2 family endonuclease [Chloroflexi bacterium]|nr:Uma2 family endonuclease [Chloroflexota bacterium]